MSKVPQIPGYRIIERLGRGGMADVYLGIQEKLDRKVAIKVMAAALFRDEQFSKRFIKEAQTAAKLVHPGIVTIHDVGQLEETHYIVMEYLEDSLKNRIKQTGLMKPGPALEIIKMISKALDYAHQKGFIHRDIKPDNIMFRSDGTAVLVDFGIARAMDATTQLTRTGTSIGTPHYMSPEQCLGEKIDGRSDIYSLGVVLYELLTGHVPYQAENTTGVIIKHIQEAVPLLPKDLSQYQHLIDAMMAKDRTARVQSAAELIKFIDAFTTAQEFMPPPPHTEPESSIPTIEETFVPEPQYVEVMPTRLERPRKKFLLPGLLIAALVVLAGAAILFITRTPPGETGKTTPPLEQKTIEKKTIEKPGEIETKTDTGTKEIIPQEKGTGSTVAKSGDTQKPLIDPWKGTKIQQTKAQPLEDKKKTEQVKESKPEIKSPAPVRTVSLLELSPEIRKTYTEEIQRIQIPTLDAKFVVKGQIFLDLSIDDQGRVQVRQVQDLLIVIPPRRKELIKTIILRKMNALSLAPPLDKAGEPVKLGSWRITFKVGKYMNRITLTKQ